MKNAALPSAVTALPQEIELVQRAISGDADAFARLYDMYIDQVYRFIFFRVGDEPTAEDLTSQVFIKAWDHLDRYQMRGLSFRVWLLRIARNTVIDYYRTRKSTTSLDGEALTRPDLVGDVDQEVEQQLEAEEIRAVLQQLTEDQRQVLILKFIEGLSTEEIARITGKRQGAIRALQMRGLQALVELMGKRDE